MEYVKKRVQYVQRLLLQKRQNNVFHRTKNVTVTLFSKICTLQYSEQISKTVGCSGRVADGQSSNETKGYANVKC